MTAASPPPSGPSRLIASRLELEYSPTHIIHVYQGIKQFALENEDWHLVEDRFAEARLEDNGRPRYDGVVGRATKELCHNAAAIGIPIVNVKPTGGVTELAPSVLPDFQGALRMAVDHLIARGLRNIGALITNEPFWRNNFKTVREYVAQQGLNYTTCVLPSKPARTAKQWDREQTLMRDWVDQWSKPIGVLTIIDHHAAVLADLCTLQRGIVIPHELALVGLGNNPNYCERPGISLSSVDMNYPLIGYRAAELLNDLIDGMSPPDAPIMVEPKGVVARQSTDVLAVDDPDVAVALRFIAENCDQPIQVADVAHAAAVSLRLLQIRFSDVLKRTIVEQIEIMRIERAKRLLVQSNEPAKTLARRCGFGNYHHFLRTFQRREHMSPGAYRKRHHAKPKI